MRYGSSVFEYVLVVHRQHEAQLLYPVSHIHRFFSLCLRLGIGEELLYDKLQLLDLLLIEVVLTYCDVSFFNFTL